MHVNVFKSLDVQYRSRLMQCNVILCNVNNIELKTRGISKIHVTYGQVTFEQEFIIAEDINENCIIGIDVIRKQGFLIDGSDGTVSIKRKSEPGGELLSSRSIRVPPKSAMRVPCRLACANSVGIKPTFLFEPECELPEGVHFEPSLLNEVKQGHVFAVCVNGSNSTVVIERKSRLGSVINDAIVVEAPVLNNTTCELEILKQISFDGICMENKKKLVKLLKNYTDIFATTNSNLGNTGVIKHVIDVQGQPPIKQRAYRVPYSQKPIIKKHIEEMLDKGIIVPSKSPWSFPVVLVKKKSGETRFCVDYRKLNKITKKDCYPLPRIDEILDILHTKKYFSTLDLASGFWQIEVEPKDQEKTAFVVENDLFHFRKLPFGLCNSPSTFMRAMNYIFDDLIGRILYIFLDDIIITSSTFEEHLENLEKVFDRLRKAGLKLKPNKCHFLQKEIEFLGHKVSERGIAPDDSKIEKIRDFPTPRNAKEVKSFLGLSGYYRRFIKGYATISHPLTELTSLKTQFKWGENEQRSFDLLRTCLTTKPILAFPDFSKPFAIFTDASDTGIGAILSQTLENNERVIAYASRHLNAAERNYATVEKEALAIVFAVKKFNAYIHGHETKIVTDHAPLKWLMKVKDTNPKLTRWALQIQDLNLDIQYRPGRVNQNADCLSRIPISSIEIHTPDDITSLQRKDSFCNDLLKYLEHKILPPENSFFFNVKIEEFFIDNDDSLKRERPPCGKRRRFLPTIQLVVPQSLKIVVMKALHDLPMAGHPGFQKTYDRITEKFFWLNMHQEIKEYCTACHSCSLGKSNPHHRKAPLQPLPVANEPFERISMDVVGPLKQTHNGNQYILVMIDSLTKWPEATAIPNQTAETIAKIFVENIICRHGMPKSLLTDRGTNFVSKLFQSICSILKIDRLLTTSYKPSTNGLCEHENNSLKDMLMH